MINLFLRGPLELSSIFRAAAIAAHLDDAGIEASDDLDEVLLSGHDGIDVFVDKRNFVRPSRKHADPTLGELLLDGTEMILLLRLRA